MRYALLGKNIQYSLSPKLHEIILPLLDIKGEYFLIDTEESGLDEDRIIQETLEKLKKYELNGINVTIPYKEKIMEYLDECSPIAKRVGAVNTIKYEDGKLIGYNTDYFGVLESIKKIGVNVEGKKCYIFGTGGSAKAVREVMKELKGEVIFVSREKRAKDTINYEDACKLNSNQVLGINCTPREISENIAEKFQQIFDLKYNKNLENMYMNKNIIDGLYMLVVQGIESQNIWNNREFKDYEQVFEILKKER